jgi:hypothetical protein
VQVKPSRTVQAFKNAMGEVIIFSGSEVIAKLPRGAITRKRRLITIGGWRYNLEWIVGEEV